MATVRQATEQDLPRIIELYREMVTSTSVAESGSSPALQDYARVFHQIQATPGHELLVIEQAGEVIGSMVFFIVPNLSHGGLPWACIENMVVDSRRQRQGFGRLLMDYALCRARESGCYKLQLSSTRTRDAAHQFYRSQGFEDSAVGFRRYL